MKTTVDWVDFRRAFEDYGREDQFSYDGLRALYDYLCELEDSCGEEFELDVIGLCSDFTEYTWGEFHADYDAETYPDAGSIQDETTYIEINEDRFIVGPL